MSPEKGNSSGSDIPADPFGFSSLSQAETSSQAGPLGPDEASGQTSSVGQVETGNQVISHDQSESIPEPEKTPEPELPKPEPTPEPNLSERPQIQPRSQESGQPKETAANAEVGDFSTEELAAIEKYADQLEHDAKSDQYMADLLHQFLQAARKQHTSTNSTPPAPSAAPNTPPAPADTVDKPESASPTIPDAAAAIAAALAETDTTPLPSQAPIVTPAGGFPGAMAGTASEVAA